MRRYERHGRRKERLFAQRARGGFSPSWQKAKWVCQLFLPLTLIWFLAGGAAWGARRYEFKWEISEPFEVVDFAANLDDDKEQRGQYTRVEWEAQSRTRAAGSILGRLTVTVLGFAGDKIVSHSSDPYLHMGMESITTTGFVDVHKDEWFRARTFVVRLAPVEPRAQASGLYIRKLNVFPGSILARGNIVPLQWSTVITTKPGPPSDVHLVLRIWGKDKHVVASYPIMQTTLAPRSRIKLSHMMIVTDAEWSQADSVTVDVVSTEIAPAR